ncbi:serine/arginine repetitive matrix protein 3-like isoform X2 [Penaeus chinensis]|uniref:serine/arginine repetitive matrix protein 3-like isoform X2 n=1 Tax=Penaeus chinensis TaxID=139456 RepID=UPI001FB7E2F0|nr:serine/arginine repetitive matrix protein 3-like isoform X2 [Penaeus chinensis]
MTEKGLTMERSPSSGLGVGVFSPHIGGGGGAWDQQQNAIITKIASTPSNRRSTATDNQERERRRRRSADKNAMNQNRNCGCGGWAHAVQLEHDLTELKATHENLLAGLHQQIESLKQKNRDLTFQVLMGPYAAGVKTDVPLSPESDEVASPKSESSKKIEESAKKEPSPAASTTSTSTTSTTVKEAKDIKGDAKDSKDISASEPPLKAKQEAEELVNGDITRVVRRPYPGRSGRGDPRLVRSLDLELLEEEAIHSRRLLEEERAKNKYLTTLIEDLKRLFLELTPLPSPEGRDMKTDRLENSASPVFNRAPAEAPPPRPPTDKEPRFPPLRQAQQQHGQEGQGKHNRSSNSPRRSSEREGGTTTLPAINQARPHQEAPQPQPRGRGRHNGRGRPRHRQQQQNYHHQDYQERRHDTTTDSEVSEHQPRGRRPPSLTRGGGRHAPRDDSRSRQEAAAPASAPPRDSSQGRRGGRQGRDGSAGPSSYPQGDKRGAAAAQEQEGRTETRLKGRGRAQRRGGRGRTRKEKHSAPPDAAESEQ